MATKKTQIEAFNEAQIHSHEKGVPVCIIRNGVDDFDWKPESEIKKADRDKVVQTFSVSKSVQPKKKKGK